MIENVDRKYLEDSHNIVNQINLIENFRILYPKVAEYTFKDQWNIYQGRQCIIIKQILINLEESSHRKSVL